MVTGRVSPKIGEEFKAKGGVFDSFVIQKDITRRYRYLLFGITRKNNAIYMEQVSQESTSLSRIRRELRKYAVIDL